MLLIAMGLFATVTSAQSENPATGPEVVSAYPTAVRPQALQPRYPAAQLRKGVSGYALVQFRLDDAGKPQDAKVVMADPPDAFGPVVLSNLRRVRFEVPAEWAARNPDRLMEMAYVFLIEKCVDKNLFPGIETVTVTAWRNRTDRNPCLPAAASETGTDSPAEAVSPEIGAVAQEEEP